MAASWQDHINIKLTLPDAAESTGEWALSAKGLKPTGLPQHAVIAGPRRALDGTLRAHVLQSAGVPVVFTDYTPVVRLDTHADLETWKAYLGKTLYYVPSFHDPADHQSYAVQVFVERLGVPEAPGPTIPYMYLPVRLIDAD